MATNKIVLFQLGTLCFMLLVLLLPAVHAKKGTGVLALYGTARCKSNPSRTINNATLQVTINGTVVATGEIKTAGRFLLVANVTSGNQLVALITSNEATITAPPGVCSGGGVPAATAAGRKLVAAVVHLSAGSDDDVLEINDWMHIHAMDRFDSIAQGQPILDAFSNSLGIPPPN